MSAATTASAARPARRRFLQRSGALVLVFTLTPYALAQGASRAVPGSLRAAPLLESWIRIDAEGIVTVFTGKAELGQGVKTALLQVAAEELAVAPARVRMITADTARTPDEGYTAGSNSLKDSGTAIRHAAAQVRELLQGLAASRLGAAADTLEAVDGLVRARDGRSIAYGALVGGLDLRIAAQPNAPLRPPNQHTVVGKPLPRIDIPPKLTGGAAYVQDLRMPDMLHGRVVRPPGPAARLRALDTGPVERMPGVRRIVRDGSFVAVVADKEWQAIVAMRALARGAQWEQRASLPAGDVHAHLERLPADTSVLRGDDVDVAGAAWTRTATYRRPYQMHGAIGPSCAVAQLDNGSLTLWTHSQGVYPLRGAIAELTRLPPERVRCIHMEGAGCYGHNGADDVAADAALIALAMPGRPVRVQWMREQEHAWEPYGPAMVARARAVLDASGRVALWDYEVRSNTHSMRPGRAGHLLAAQHLATPFEVPAPRPIPQPEGGGDRNAIPLYRFPRVRVTHHFVPDMPARVSALRALGAYANVFAIECFMDELALAAAADAVEFRLRHLEDARAATVLREAAERFQWGAWKRQRGRGRGIAFARYKNLAAYCAVACEVDVDRASGDIRVLRAVAAIDSGEAVNPDGIRNQVEGGIVQSLSWTLYEAVEFDGLQVRSRDWGNYPILRFGRVPDVVEVHVVDRPGSEFLGTGEAAQGPAAAALANAVADASGVRVRDLPLTAARVKAALGV